MKSPTEELEALREEHERLLAAYGRLKWAMDGERDKYTVHLGLTPLRARLLALLMTGRQFTAEHLIAACWDNDDVGIDTVKATVWHIRQKHPWFKVKSAGRGARGCTYKLEQSSIEYVQNVMKMKDAA